MQILISTFGAYTILQIDGKLLLGEGDVLLKRSLDACIEKGRKKFILDATYLPYLDSGGLGELVRSSTSIRRAGGEMWICNSNKRLTDLLTITKLLTVFSFCDSIEDVIADASVTFVSFPCPVYDCGGSGRSPHNIEGEYIYRCARCLASFPSFIQRNPDTGAIEARISSIHMFTDRYQRYDTVTLTLGRPHEVSIRPCLDLFVLDDIKKAWRTIQLPRRVVFTLHWISRMSLPGIDGLLQLCAPEDEDSKGVILADNLDEKVVPLLPDSPLIFRDSRLAAVAALGDMSDIAVHPLIVLGQPAH